MKLVEINDSGWILLTYRVKRLIKILRKDRHATSTLEACQYILEKVGEYIKRRESGIFKKIRKIKNAKSVSYI